MLYTSDETALTRRLQKLTSILDVTKAMSAERDLDLLLPLILFEASKVVEADRCSLFILDRERNELWSKVAQGAKKRDPPARGQRHRRPGGRHRHHHQHPGCLRG